MESVTGTLDLLATVEFAIVQNSDWNGRRYQPNTGPRMADSGLFFCRTHDSSDPAFDNRSNRSLALRCGGKS